jgi:hypothetical protein
LIAPRCWWCIGGVFIEWLDPDLVKFLELFELLEIVCRWGRTGPVGRAPGWWGRVSRIDWDVAPRWWRRRI